MFSASISKIQVMEDGEDPELNMEELHEIYRQMMLARKFDEKAFKLQRRGEISTYAPHKGQEASQIGAVHALRDGDWTVPSFRETAMYIARGAPLQKLFQRWMGDVRGQADLENDLPVAVPVGTQNLHAAGIGMSMEMNGEEKAVLGFTGDGSTSQGDFYEALNFAGAFDAHSAFLVQNNRYAISMPVERQTNAETLAQKAVAAGIDGVQCDGNDVLAVRRAVSRAVEKARQGEPFLVEALTYRLEDHTTSDDSTRYRDEDEVEQWSENDPLEQFKQYLKSKEMWSEDLVDYGEEAEEEVNSAAKEAMEVEDPSVEDMFDYVYDEIPDHLRKQRQEWVERDG